MAFNFNKLTVKAQETFQSAIEIAQNYGNQVVEPEHLLASLIQESGGLADTIMIKTGGNTNFFIAHEPGKGKGILHTCPPGV